MSKNRERIPHKMRFEVLKRDAYTCRYCGAKAPTVKLDLDHVQPLAAGGATTAANLVVACKTCNSGKSGDRLPTEQEKATQTTSELRKVAAIVKNRWAEFEPVVVTGILERAAASGKTAAEMRTWALTAGSWAQWLERMEA